MAKSHHKPTDRDAITEKKSAGNGKSAAVKKKDSPVRKVHAAAPKKNLLTPGRSPASIEKVRGFSKLSLTLIILTFLIVVIGGMLVWDGTANGFSLFGNVGSLFTKQEEHVFGVLPINNAEPPGPTPENMAWIPGGWFWMGSDDENHKDSHPIHKVYVDGFWMGKYEATNAEWQEFAEETKYLTVAEKPPDPDDFPHIPPEEVRKFKPFSLVFSPPVVPLRDLNDHTKWWTLVEGASWKHPLGPKSNITEAAKLPVVHICWLDTQEFLKWKNKKNPPKEGWEYRLPTEAEWEFAARGGLHMKKFLWGDELQPGGKWLANIWQGNFPNHNSKEDGYVLAAPVGSYPANDFGMYDMAGNVWEWCHDWYLKDYYKDSPEKNPTGPLVGFDPLEPGAPKRVQRGGSFLCDASYCERYLTYTRGKGEITSASNHVGFRYVLAPKIAALK